MLQTKKKPSFSSGVRLKLIGIKSDLGVCMQEITSVPPLDLKRQYLKDELNNLDKSWEKNNKKNDKNTINKKKQKTQRRRQ